MNKQEIEKMKGDIGINDTQRRSREISEVSRN